MKIVCDACQAKYSISDDKVQGKVFKIRCKKCSNIIVVRGGAGAAEAPAPEPQKDTRVYDYGYDGAAAGGAGGDESVWHVVINQDQVGPMTAAEVQSKFSSGEIDAETYAWREGFADWLPLSQIDAFASLASGSAAPSASGGGGAAAVSSMFGGGDESGTTKSDPGDLFAAASGSARGGGATDDEGDLFGGSPSRGTGGGATSESKLRGERNENSVLFSLNNLAQLASDKPAHSAGVTSTPSGHATGAAGGEGSGLIDIRSMANAYLGGSAGAAKPASASAGIGSIDDLPVFGGTSFSEPQVIVPTASRQSNNKMMFALIGSVGVLAIAAVILVVVLLSGRDKPSAAGTTAAGTTGSGEQVASNDPGKTDEPKTGEPAKTDEPKTGEPAKTDEPKTGEPAKTDEPKTKEPAPKTTPKTGSTTVAPKEPKTTPPPVERPVAKGDGNSGGGACDEVSCVLNNYEGACCSKLKKGKSGGSPAPVKTGGGDAPDGLDRTMISDGVNKVKPRVMACGDKSSAKGQVKVSVKVNPGGDVASVTVKATPDAGLGNCVASAVQKARFAKTQNGGSFGYPFVF